ncbi:FecR domain-containing protein [Xenophilus sp.]|uniref:FecR domain-containing protein n=1 Tax=Xenophilus sp. TaxID=1873499 RepID=UPI0037DD4924
MTRRRSIRIGLCALALFEGLAGPAVAQQQPSPPPGRTHTVRPGETLWDITRQHLGRPLLWPGVQQRNRVGEPRLLQIGRVLHFDDSERQAVVLAATGDVRMVDGLAVAGGPPAGALLAAGSRLPEGSRLRTGADSFVTLRLPDGSRTTLPSRSQARLVRYFDASGRPSVLVELESGDLESRVPLRGHAPAADAWRVRTRMATIGVRGTHFRVSLPDPANAAVSVLESAVAVQAPARAPVRVPEAKGLLAGDSPLAGQVQDLLPAPDWVEPGRPQNQPGVLLAWNGVAGAGSYHVQLARDAEFIDLAAEQRLPAGGGRELALFDGIAPGSYFARVAAVTPEGVEGLLSMAGFSRAQASLDGTARWLADRGELAFSWSAVPGATYTLEVADDEQFRRLAVQAGGLQGEEARVQALPPGQYWWRVRAEVVDQGQRSELVGPARPLLVEGVR